MQKILVTGDMSTRDKLKLSGFVKGFSKIGETEYIEPNLRDNIKNKNFCDILFGESADWFDIDYSNIKNVFIWGLIDPKKFMDISKKYNNTNFFICSKSLIHEKKIIEEYLEIYGNPKYMQYGMEGIDVKEFIKMIETSEKLDDCTYRITENIYYMYLPCSLASPEICDVYGKKDTKDIDITYFGTRENRPGVSEILNFFESSGYNVVYNNPGIFISPEQCIEYYGRSIVTLHEQVGPVYLEFPVRFGEASYCGSKIFSLDRMTSLRNYSEINENLPVFDSDSSKDELIKKIIAYIDLRKNGNINEPYKDYTYEYYCKKIINLSK